MPYYRDGECLRSVGCSDDAAVAIGLFLVVFVLFYEYVLVPVKLAVVAYRGKIGGWQECGHADVLLGGSVPC